MADVSSEALSALRSGEDHDRTKRVVEYLLYEAAVYLHPAQQAVLERGVVQILQGHRPSR